MAKAKFHKHQKVWVEAVGAWTSVEKIIPIWSKDFDEPVKITYEVGLGREFRAEELRAEETDDGAVAISGEWRLMRAKNKWQSTEETGHHPYPGTFPVVVTDPNDWGGWRTPGAEYDRDPERIERQARLIASAPKLLKLAEDLASSAGDNDGDAPPDLVRLGRTAAAIVRAVTNEGGA